MKLVRAPICEKATNLCVNKNLLYQLSVLNIDIGNAEFVFKLLSKQSSKPYLTAIGLSSPLNIQHHHIL